MDKLSQMVLMGAAGKKGFNPNTPIGTFVEGGFFTGFINQGGQKYAIIVAPKASGENSSRAYKNAQTAAPAATQTLNNGPAASGSMTTTTYPASRFCQLLNINGFSDWYLPARDELELCYRNLKPTTQANNTSNRPKSSIVYPEGDDVSADTFGVNRNSDPTGAAYTSGNPAQTSVTLFQSGGTEAFAVGIGSSFSYWSSSESSAAAAWRQIFSDGGQGSNFKDSLWYVRAVRRVPV